MPLGSPATPPPIGSAPLVPTRNYGGGAGKIFTNPWGAKTTAPKGVPPPTGLGSHGFGEVHPELKAAFGPFAPRDPQSAADAKNLLNEQSPQGSVFKDQISALRRKLMQNREM